MILLYQMYTLFAIDIPRSSASSGKCVVLDEFEPREHNVDE
jgi:hypothetical protein